MRYHLLIYFDIGYSVLLFFEITGQILYVILYKQDILSNAPYAEFREQISWSSTLLPRAANIE